jgi:uncharacterized protein
MLEDRELGDILDYWSFWDGRVPDTVPRVVSLPKELSPKLALVVQGVRRCGKSTLLAQLLNFYALPPERCVFVNFEDPKLSQVLSPDLLSGIVNFFSTRHSRGDLFFFLDEIQEVNGWQRWLRTRLEKPGRNHFIITGSNASLLSGEFSSVLTGRHLKVELFPFSLEEARRYKKRLKLREFLSIGGFPEPLINPDGQRLLKQYFDDIIERDLRERVGSRSALPVRQVVQMAYETAGSELSLRRISGAVGISVETAGSYLQAAEDAYLLFSCPFFAYSVRKRNAYNKKYYPVDTGLQKAVTTKAGQDLGRMLESLVFLELKKRFSEVYYWRDRYEVDFVVQTASGLTPIQVTLDEPLDRHHQALENFYENFPQAGEAVFITEKNFEREIARLGSFRS